MIGGYIEPKPAQPEGPKLGTKEYSELVNEPHCADPRPGDYWNEMFTPILVVLGRVGGSVLYCEKTKEGRTRDTWTWDLSKIEIATLAEFRKKLSYNLIPGFHCDCFPGAHLWAAEAAFGDIQ